MNRITQAARRQDFAWAGRRWLGLGQRLPRLDTAPFITDAEISADLWYGREESDPAAAPAPFSPPGRHPAPSARPC